MKKTGFTLSEVLITLTIIGIISALTLPSMLSNYQAKTVGVKLSKLVNQVEQTAIPYVADNDTLSSADNISNYINKTFLFKDILDANGKSTQSTKYNVYSMANITETAVLKDGTTLKVQVSDGLSFSEHKDKVDVLKVGAPKFILTFNPKIKGLSSTAQQVYSFAVTEQGYIYPHDADECLWSIYENGYVTTADTFATAACNSAVKTNNSDGGIGSGNDLGKDQGNFQDKSNDSETGSGNYDAIKEELNKNINDQFKNFS